MEHTGKKNISNLPQECLWCFNHDLCLITVKFKGAIYNSILLYYIKYYVIILYYIFTACCSLALNAIAQTGDGMWVMKKDKYGALQDTMADCGWVGAEVSDSDTLVAKTAPDLV